MHVVMMAVVEMRQHAERHSTGTSDNPSTGVCRFFSMMGIKILNAISFNTGAY
jgi:hypothetical protein